jgi:hypothetical protein
MFDGMDMMWLTDVDSSKPIEGRVSGPIAALSGSHQKAPGFAGGWLLGIKKYILYFSAATLVIFSFFGCDYGAIKENNLLGAWRIPLSEKKQLSNFYQDNKIILNSDHTFVANNLPVEIFGNLFDNKYNSISGGGSWHLDKLKLRLIFILINNKTASAGTVFEIQTGKVPVMFFFLGDPDENRRIELQKL